MNLIKRRGYLPRANKNMSSVHFPSRMLPGSLDLSRNLLFAQDSTMRCLVSLTYPDVTWDGVFQLWRRLDMLSLLFL